MAAIKNRCFFPICHILKLYEYLLNLSKRVYHRHSRVNIKCHFQMSRSMLRSVLHFEHENLRITIYFCYYFNFGYVRQGLKGYIVFLHNLEVTIIYLLNCEMKYCRLMINSPIVCMVGLYKRIKTAVEG